MCVATLAGSLFAAGRGDPSIRCATQDERGFFKHSDLNPKAILYDNGMFRHFAFPQSPFVLSSAAYRRITSAPGKQRTASEATLIKTANSAGTTVEVAVKWSLKFRNKVVAAGEIWRTVRKILSERSEYFPFDTCHPQQRLAALPTNGLRLSKPPNTPQSPNLDRYLFTSTCETRLPVFPHELRT